MHSLKQNIAIIILIFHGYNYKLASKPIRGNRNKSSIVSSSSLLFLTKYYFLLKSQQLSKIKHSVPNKHSCYSENVSPRFVKFVNRQICYQLKTQPIRPVTARANLSLMTSHLSRSDRDTQRESETNTVDTQQQCSGTGATNK